MNESEPNERKLILSIFNLESRYEETWKPIAPAKRQDYDYSFNPINETEFLDSGVGHVTQVI